MKSLLERVFVVGLMAAIVAVVMMNIPARSGVTSLSGVIDSTLTDTTAADTSNCIDLYKPYPIRIPPGTDSLVGRALLQDFADYLDIQVDEIYARVRAAVCQKLAEEIEVVDAIPPCTIAADTLWPCSDDTLTLIFQAVAIKDTGTARDIGTSIIMYEGLNDSSTTDGVPGPEFAGFVVNRANGSGNADTNSIEESYRLVMPINNGSSENRRVPGNTNSLGTNTSVTGNSELLTDADGNLYWIDRDWFSRILIDTIIADTMNTGGGDGTIDVFAQHINLKGYDENRALVGKWIGTGVDPTSIHFYEAQDYGTMDVEVRPQENMLGSWDLELPDTSSEWEPSIWRFPKNANEAPTWIPFDNQYTVWGIDTVRGTGASISHTITISKGHWPTAPNPRPGQAMPYYSLREFYPEVEWVIPNPDSIDVEPYFAWGATDAPVGCPGPNDWRWNALFVVSTYDADFHSLGDPRYATDSTFIVNLPVLGTANDSMWVFKWKATGTLFKHLGRG